MADERAERRHGTWTRPDFRGRPTTPRRLHKAVRPFPWLAVHPAGHELEGLPIEREGVGLASLGGCGLGGDGEWLQQQIDREWLARQRLGVIRAFEATYPVEPDGSMWTPILCPRCERRALDAEAVAVAAPPAAWFDAIPREAPSRPREQGEREQGEPEQGDWLFGGS